jgi:hypothetical protein
MIELQASRLRERGGYSAIVVWNRLDSFFHRYISVPGPINHKSKARVDRQNYSVANIPVTVASHPLNIDFPTVLELHCVGVSVWADVRYFAPPTIFGGARKRNQAP